MALANNGMCRKIIAFAILLVIALASICGKSALAAEEGGTQTSGPTAKKVVFEDSFDREDLGPNYSVFKPDANRLLLSDGKVLIAPATERANQVHLKKRFSGDFVATISAKMRVTENNYVALYYWLDQNNHVAIGIAGSPKLRKLPWTALDVGSSFERRQPYFTKVVGGQLNDIAPNITELGGRDLKGYANADETWYLQLQRVGSRYFGRMSVDGVNWTEFGPHLIVQKDGQIGFGAGSGGDIENPVEFDNFVVQE